jgi:hypothetical protein
VNALSNRRKLVLATAVFGLVVACLVAYAASDGNVFGRLGSSLDWLRRGPPPRSDNDALDQTERVSQAREPERDSQARPSGERLGGAADLPAQNVIADSSTDLRNDGGGGTQVDEENAQDDSAWAVSMEQRIWATLPTISTRFTTIQLVKCEAGMCEIQYTSPDLKAVEIMPRLTLALGMDDRGMPIAKTMGFTHREVAAGALVTVVTFTTEPP